ncbi:MAG: DUF1566 domain-containing protein [Nitrospinae bacterium]|nr:DUF1566 domain-containing protein [Nitrospinota bacterium]MZH13456.1 DUF1566 domain-containing protein [Nitrospinota bacterium]
MKLKIPTLIMTILVLLGLSLMDTKFAESVSLKSPRFIDNRDGTITDSKTGLMWMKNDSYLHSGHWLNWYEAKAFIQQLNESGFANYFDWQYPTTRELKTLFDADKLNSAQVGREMKIHTDPLFGKKGSGSLWSADENGRHNAFGVVFNTGDVFSGNKKSRSRKATRAVRKHLNN